MITRLPPIDQKIYNLPVEKQVRELGDYLMRYRRESEFLLNGNIDSTNVRSITTDQLVAGKAKIGTAMIDELIVGSNVGLGTAQDATGVTTIVGGLITTDYIKALGLKVGDHIAMGPDATISWNKVTNQPTIPSQYTNSMALDAWENSGYATYINASGVYSGSFNGGMFNINPTGSRYLESGLTVGGYWGGSWKGQALKLQFYESGGGGTPVTALSSSGGVPLWFDVQTRFNSLVDFSSATVTGLNYASENHNHGNDYVKSYTGQNLSLVATETGIAVRVNGVTLGSIFMINRRENSVKVEMNERMISNLRVFLDRTDLKGGDVPAFVEIQNAINMAKIEDSPTNANANCKRWYNITIKIEGVLYHEKNTGLYLWFFGSYCSTGKRTCISRNNYNDFNVISIKINGEMVVKSGESFILANGNKVPYTIVYNGTTYLPLRETVRLVGKDLVFDGAMGTADIVDKAIDDATKNVSEVDKMPGETKPVTRAEFARWLVQSFELTDDGTRYELPDIKENDEYYIDICISIQHKYLGIYTNTLFSPLDKVSRWQYLYVMLFNVFEINLDDYEPASKEVMKDAYKYDEDTLKMIGAALELELLTLYEDGTFRPYDLLIMGLTPNKELQKYIQN